MIFYFTGTGNSLWLARQLASEFREDIISISDELKKTDYNLYYNLNYNEKIIFVFPVHSWGPAVLVLDFIKRMNINGYIRQDVYMICTCGDNCGKTSGIISKALKKKKISLTKGYSLQMPNNYILMSGFNTDPIEIEKEKLDNAPRLINSIVENIRTKKDEQLYITGSKPFLKSSIVYPLFRKFALGRNSFYAKEYCISCGLCAKICPTNTITIENGKPKWGNSCVQCTACIHRCPVYAIEYGKITRDKGRYHHPDI